MQKLMISMIVLVLFASVIFSQEIPVNIFIKGTKDGITISLDLNNLPTTIRSTDKSLLIPMTIENDTDTNLDLNPLTDDLTLVIGDDQAQVKLLSLSSPDRYPSKLLSHAKVTVHIEVIPTGLPGFIVGVAMMKEAGRRYKDDPEKLNSFKMFRGVFDLGSKKIEIPIETVFSFGQSTK